MRKISIKHDMRIPGWGLIKEGETYKVLRFNQRFVYVELKTGVTLRLARKRDCNVMY